MKKCNKCLLTKPHTDFHKDSSKFDGYRTTCKTCKSLSDKNYKLNNKESCKNRDREYYLANKEKCNLNSKRYYEENKERLLSIQRKYNDNRREFLLEYLRNYYKAKKNTEEYQRKYEEYYRENKSAFLDRAARRRAAKLNAIPPWLTKDHFDEIKDFYIAAKMFKIYTGQDYHVDHIVPLQGKDVCGLHVPWNLQILTAQENLSKSNKH
jgi:hypothetical protein